MGTAAAAARPASSGGRHADAGHDDRGDRKGGKSGKGGKGGKDRGAPGRWARVQVNLGRDAGIRPQDLVGATTNEAGLRGNEVGAVEIADRFAVVEVPVARAADVAAALSATRIRGRKTKARVLRDGPS